MKLLFVIILSLFVLAVSASGQGSDNADFNLALPDHPGQLRFQAQGFQIVQSSAKPNGNEIGIRGSSTSGLGFLAFLFLLPEQKSLTSAACRDIELNTEKQCDRAFKISSLSDIRGNPPIALASYTYGKKMHAARAFIASSNLCGDLEFYSSSSIDANDPRVKAILGTLQLDPTHAPQFRDVFLYAELLYHAEQYKPAAHLFEKALTMLPDGANQQTQRRILTDQAGMAYGISGDINKARDIFNAAIANDPDYPLYYYNLACADAEEHKLADARVHLQQAFERKANVIKGESIPDPTKDDSFTPYRNDKAFWDFLKTLH